MGREIVYCQGCGKRLTETDFEKRKAHSIGHQHFCTTCEPLPQEAARTPATGTRRPSGSRNPLATPRTPQRSISAVPSGPQQSPATLLYVAGGALALIVVGLLAWSSGKESPHPPAHRTPAPKPADRGAESLQELERFLATRPEPHLILAQVEAARTRIAGTRHEERLRQIEAQAQEALQKPQPPTVDRLTPFLREIRILIDKDEAFSRKNDVLSMLETAAKMAGDRSGEVLRLRADYEQKLKVAGAPADLVLLPGSARLSGVTLHLAQSGGQPTLAGFNDLDCIAEWTLDVPRAGLWRVSVTQAVDNNAGGEYAIVCGPEQLRAKAESTGSWDIFATRDLGQIRLPQATVTLLLKPIANKGGIMNFRGMKFAWAGD